MKTMSISLMDRTKGYLTLKVVSRVVDKIRGGDIDAVADLFESLAKIAPSKYHKESFKLLAKKIRDKDPFSQPFIRAIKGLNPLCIQKILQNLFVNFMVIGRSVRDRKMRELGVHLPNFMVISPTMKCNLHCRGCYAGKYDQKNDLPYEVFDRILTEGKSLGMYFYTLSGGEILLYPRIFELWEKHSDCYFQFYTNGTLLTDEIIDRIAALGNVAPMISIEGTKAHTDARRGQGIYENIFAVYAKMKEKGMPYGFSTTFTNLNADYIISGDFISTMVDAGCTFGWLFQYIPIGVKPDLTYMASPEQRNELREKTAEWRRNGTYPMIFGDFWNDGPYVDGCMAGGRRYWHVIHNGMVEPCVFAPFAVDNVKEKSLVEIAKSPFFKAIRDAQPYDDDNLFRPCMIIDHPEVLRTLVKEYGAKPCHEGLEAMLEGEVAEGLDKYSEDFREISDPKWDEYGRDNYWKGLEREDDEYTLGKARKHLPEACLKCSKRSCCG